MAAFRDKSPFPGMNPYLQRHWPDVHVTLIGHCRDALNDLLPPDLIARAEQQVGIGGDEDVGERPTRATPDVRVWQPSSDAESDDGGVAVMAAPPPRVKVAPMRLRLDSPRKRRWLEIREADGGRLVTVVEFLSPANKRGRGRREFVRKRNRLLRGRVNVVEIDLTRGGPWRRLFGGMSLPAAAAATYRVAIFVPARGGRFVPWLHPMPLREPLAEITIPLRRKEPPVKLALQPLVDRAYHGGRYGRTTDYAKPPDPPLSADDAAWAGSLLAESAAAPGGEIG